MGLLDFLFGSTNIDRTSNLQKKKKNYSSGYNDSYDRGYENGYEDCCDDHECSDYAEFEEKSFDMCDNDDYSYEDDNCNYDCDDCDD